MSLHNYFSVVKKTSSSDNKPLAQDKDKDKEKIKKNEKNDSDFQEPVVKSSHFKEEKTQPVKKTTAKKAITESKPVKPTKATKTEPVEPTKPAEPVVTIKKPVRKTAAKKRLSNTEDDDYSDPSETEATAKKVKKNQTPEVKSETKPEVKRNYFAHLNKEPPKLLGTRPQPVGAPNCLEGMTFVISGQYETLTKEQTRDIVMRYGGRVTTGVSGKTTHLLRGRDAGESKLAKAKSVGTKIVDEDEFYNLVESTAGKKSSVADVKPPVEKPIPKATPSSSKSTASPSVSNSSVSNSSGSSGVKSNSQLWTEKYKPTDLKDIIGNKDLVKRIANWLENWSTLYKKGFVDASDEMNSFRAILISGPPGIGKTTTATVAARSLGYEPLEFNASDVRSKSILEETISEMIDNRTMTEFFQASKASTLKNPEISKLVKGKKVVLIMDEVDGMSGGDRGGSAELAQLIRKTKIPVICICNDPRSTKVAPLLKVCFEAKFRRTPAAQIRSRMFSIAHREGLSISANALEELVASTQNDIRQIINIMSTYKLKEDKMDYDEAKAVGKMNQKNSILGLFDIPGELLSSNNWRAKSLNEKYEIYFHDYALSHLMIYENYLKSTPNKASEGYVSPKEAQCNEMDLIAKAANAITDGDLVDKMIHGTIQHWSLMPVHSIFSCVRPASYMEGIIRTRVNFPGWLGQNSKASRYSKALSDIQTRMRLTASGDKFEIRQNYIPTLNDRLFGALKNEQFDDAVGIMDRYYLERENLETLGDLTFSSGKGPYGDIPTKTKTAFTRDYNSRKHPILFQDSGAPIKKVSAGPKEDAVGMIVEDDIPVGEEVPELDEEDDPEKEIHDTKYIKESKSLKRKAATTKATSRKQKVKK